MRVPSYICCLAGPINFLAVSCTCHLACWKVMHGSIAVRLVGVRMHGFLGALSCRYAVAKATKRDTEAVVKCRDVVEGLMGEFLQVSIPIKQQPAACCQLLCMACS